MWLLQIYKPHKFDILLEFMFVSSSWISICFKIYIYIFNYKFGMHGGGSNLQGDL